MVTTQASPGSRERLLLAATDAFAEHGFRGARVRDICRQAAVNLAAINYHYGDKRRLYHEVLQNAFFSLVGGDPTDWGVPDDASPEERLRAFIRSLLMQLLSEGRHATHAKLVGREMVDPTDAIDRVIEEGIRPQTDILLDLVAGRLGREPDDLLVRRCASSILGQCLFYYFARPAILRLPLENHLGPDDVESIAAHVATFSLAALDEVAVQAHRR